MLPPLTVADLLKGLEGVPPHTIVKLYDAKTGMFESATFLVHITSCEVLEIRTSSYMFEHANEVDGQEKNANGEGIKSWTNEYVVQRMLENYARTISTGSESQHNEAFRCQDEVFRRMYASTPLPVDLEQQESDEAAFARAAEERERGELVDLDDVASVDLEEKLSGCEEYIKDLGIGAACDPDPVTMSRESVRTLERLAYYGGWDAAAALGRAEAIEEAAKVCENVIGVPESKIRAYLAEAIRALKEKGF